MRLRDQCVRSAGPVDQTVINMTLILFSAAIERAALTVKHRRQGNGEIAISVADILNGEDAFAGDFPKIQLTRHHERVTKLARSLRRKPTSAWRIERKIVEVQR